MNIKYKTADYLLHSITRPKASLPKLQEFMTYRPLTAILLVWKFSYPHTLICKVLAQPPEDFKLSFHTRREHDLNLSLSQEEVQRTFLFLLQVLNYKIISQWKCNQDKGMWMYIFWDCPKL